PAKGRCAPRISFYVVLADAALAREVIPKSDAVRTLSCDNEVRTLNFECRNDQQSKRSPNVELRMSNLRFRAAEEVPNGRHIERAVFRDATVIATTWSVSPRRRASSC